ncbi:MAG TPA: glutaredoxin domain-containing protein [Anaerolineae bacterium]|nr:glutaredoxin domain-containing protein [Anaerolineae bacterium]
MTQFSTDEIVMYTTDWCPDCHRAKFLFKEYGISYREVDVEADVEAEALVKKLNNGYRIVPTILFPDGTMLVEPSNETLLAKIDPEGGVRSEL